MGKSSSCSSSPLLSSSSSNSNDSILSILPTCICLFLEAPVWAMYLCLCFRIRAVPEASLSPSTRIHAYVVYNACGPVPCWGVQSQSLYWTALVPCGCIGYMQSRLPCSALHVLFVCGMHWYFLQQLPGLDRDYYTLSNVPVQQIDEQFNSDETVS